MHALLATALAGTQLLSHRSNVGVSEARRSRTANGQTMEGLLSQIDSSPAFRTKPRAGLRNQPETLNMKSFEAIARTAYYEFYAHFQFSPDQVRPWEELNQHTRDGWIKSARKMAEEIQQVH